MASESSFLALLLKLSVCLSQRTSMEGLFACSSIKVLQCLYTSPARDLISGSSECLRRLLTVCPEEIQMKVAVFENSI